MTPTPFSDSAPLRMIELSATDVFVGMILAFALCMFLARTYSATSPSGTIQANLPRSIVLLGVTVSLIMAVIGNSLARAFGAIGALSLVRFRTAIKDPRDLAHIFMSIGIGMACGSGHFKVSIGATALLSIFSLILSYFPLTDTATKMCILRVRFPMSPEMENTILNTLRGKVTTLTLLASEALDKGQNMELVIEVGMPCSEDFTGLVATLSAIAPNIQAHLLLH
ncbi:MAG: DUF4956 domain-containing protein [Candidatus Riflebacteria bacterium]|nr:DUF4956 domain-containing protein [Candidatus Riflebacteria bacterium]